jgi:hypothetical protein
MLHSMGYWTELGIAQEWKEMAQDNPLWFGCQSPRSSPLQDHLGIGRCDYEIDHLHLSAQNSIYSWWN